MPSGTPSDTTFNTGIMICRSPRCCRTASQQARACRSELRLSSPWATSLSSSRAACSSFLPSSMLRARSFGETSRIWQPIDTPATSGAFTDGEEHGPLPRASRRPYRTA